MTPVLKSEYRILSGNPTLTTTEGDERAPLQTIIARGQAYALTYGVYLCADNPPSEPGKVAVRKPIDEWDFDPENPQVTYTLEDYVPQEVEGWQTEVAMKATPVDPEDAESQSVWDRAQDLIAAMPDGVEKITAQTVLKRGKIGRDSPMLAQLAPMVPLTQERVDDLMRLAASIEA